MLKKVNIFSFAYGDPPLLMVSQTVKRLVFTTNPILELVVLSNVKC